MANGKLGLKQAFSTILQLEVSAGPAHLSAAAFDDGMTSGTRNHAVAGCTDRCALTWTGSPELGLAPSEFHAGTVAEDGACRRIREPVGARFEHSSAAKGEPCGRVQPLDGWPSPDA